jgi:hypothetical protein
VRQLSALAVACGLLNAFAWGQAPVYIVDDTPGPLVDFSDLPAAIQAVPEGALLLVRKGTYSSFTLTKGVSIVGYYGEIPKLTPPVLIRDLPSGAFVLLSNVSIPHPSTIPLTSAYRPLTLESNEGRIWIEDVEIGAPSSGYGFGRPGLQATDCTSVVLERATISGGYGGTVWKPDPGVIGGILVYGPAGAGAGIRALRSRLTAINSTFTGGNGGSFGQIEGYSLYGSDGGIGVEAEDCELYFSGTTVRGGQGFMNLSFQGPCAKDGGAGLVVKGPGSALHHLDCQFLGGNAGWSWSFSCQVSPDSGVPIDAPSGSVLEFPGEFLGLQTPSAIASSTSATVELVGGTPGGIAFLGIGLASEDLPLPAFSGVLLLAGPTLVLPLGVLPSAAPLAVEFTLGSLPSSIQAIPFFVQCAYIEPTGDLVIGAANAGFIVDSSF